MAAGARIGRRHLGDDVLLEPVEAVILGQRVHRRRALAGVDRPAHQRDRGGHAEVAPFGHDRGRGDHRHARLAHRDHVGVGAEEVQEVDDVVDVVVEIELIRLHRDHAGVAPVGDVDLVIRQHRLDGAAKQSRVVARERGHDQHPRVLQLHLALEVEQMAVAALDHRHGLDRDRHAVDLGRRQVPFRFAVAPRRALEHLCRRRDLLAERGIGNRVPGSAGDETRRLGGPAPGHHREPGELVHLIKHDCSLSGIRPVSARVSAPDASSRRHGRHGERLDRRSVARRSEARSASPPWYSRS